ncbi:MAG: amino acid adenylation domain-containing protein [Terriglobales bacterium]|jgi:amino acid adenylation domain-containing protein
MSVARYVQDLVREHAQATPDAIALTSGSNKITYGELDARANRLAHFLRSSGVGPEVPVAICMHRSIELVVAALGILKAAGAYVPLDPTYPTHRISMLLEDSGAPLVLTQRCLASNLPAGAWRPVVLDQHGPDSAPDSGVPPVTSSKPDNLAYIIFTSGSTGRPKGVQVTHANLLHLVSWHQRAFNVTAADRATLHASPGFDASVWELWPYLAAGASVHVVDETLRTNPEALRDWIVAQGITISFLPTALAERMIDLDWPPESALRVLLTGADTLRRRPNKDLPFDLVNNYGPTECTVVATSGRVQPDEEMHEAPSIGRAIDSVNIHIVDEQLQPVPAGTSGELMIGGAGVARGYLNAAELTAERFLPDPFRKDPDARLYRTGDVGRYLPDGQIAFLGRMDEQIKIMGFRIEPQEIVAVLRRYRDIKDCLVTAYTDQSGNRRLVAYLVLATPERIKSSDLRHFLSDYLPDHMLPSTFVVLPELPRSASGKVVRSELPEPTASNILDDDSFEAPQSPIENHLAGFLSALLRVDHVGREDNFFMLGGHSLMGAQLIAKIKDSFGVELSLRSLFEEPTVRGMAAEIERLIYAKVSAMSENEAQRILASSGDALRDAV